MTDSTPSVWVVILNWNSRVNTLECLHSLQASSYGNLRVVLVDNGSTDDSVECVRKGFPEAHIMQNPRNLGYTEGNNGGIRYALERGADYVLLLNNDTVVPPETICQLIQAGEEDPSIGATCPVIVSYSDHSKHYVPTIDWETVSAGEELISSTESVSCNVDYATGCALLMKSAVIRKVGFLAPAYFAYYEDVDWSLRCKGAGYRILLVPQAIVLHKGTPDRTALKSPMLWFYYVRNQRLFASKFARPNGRFLTFSEYSRQWLPRFRQARQSGREAEAAAILDGWCAGVLARYGAERLEAPRWFHWLVFRSINLWSSCRFPIRALRYLFAAGNTIRRT